MRRAIVMAGDAAADEKERSLLSHVGIELLKRRTLMLAGEVSRESAQMIMAQLILCPGSRRR